MRGDEERGKVGASVVLAGSHPAKASYSNEPGVTDFLARVKSRGKGVVAAGANRAVWLKRVAFRWGRIVGSLCHRVIYL